MAALELGAKYSCFEDFQAALAKYSRETNSIYTVFNSKKIEAENRGRTPEKQYPVELKYRFIKYTCKHYGSNRSKSRGLRPNQSSFKIGCPAFIYLSVQKNKLVVEKMETKHSHVCDPDVLNFYPERRSISGRAKVLNLNNFEDGEGDLIQTVRDDVMDLLKLHVDRRRIRNYVRLRTNRILSAVDLANMAKQMQGEEKEVSEERSYQLLDKLTELESKENEPARMLEVLAKKEKYKALKKKIAHVKAEFRTAVNDTGNESVQEHGYSNLSPQTPNASQKWWDSSKDLSDTSPVAKKGRMSESHSIEWNSRALEEMVKSINPNEEGPVLVHMNNYDGVMVVEIQNEQGSVTQLEGTVVEIEDDLQGDEARLVSSMEDPISLTNGESPSSANRSPSKNHQPPVKTKKVIKFRKRLTPSEPSEETSDKSDLKNLIDIAMQGVQCNPKEEDLESESAKDILDNQSDGESDNGAAFGEFVSGDELHNDGDEEFNGHELRDTEKVRLEAETAMLRVKTDKLKLQVKYLRNELSKQELEKEKLRLEIVLLKARIGITDMN